MKVIILVHVESEGPGLLETYLNSLRADFQIIKLYLGESLPASSVGIDAVVSMGGPMNVYEEDTYPFLISETRFLRESVERDLPVLGICLGAQMIAKASGAAVTKSPVKEIGWDTVTLTEHGLQDTIFRGVSQTFEVLQWHEDMFQIPPHGLRLARSIGCPNQAFRYRNAVGLQFHLEVTAHMLSEWFADSPERIPILTRYREVAEDLTLNSMTLFKNFFGLVS